MEINFNTQVEKSMSDEIIELYSELEKNLFIHCKLNKLSMIITQSIGYNGFKRWHRVRSREFFELKLCLYNELYDKFRITATPKNYELTYSPNSIEEHLKSWDNSLLETIKNLGTINQKYYKLTGMNCCIAEKMMCILVRDYEKVGRLIKRFSESDWLTLDMHIVDDKLHKKFKHIEKECGYEY